MAGLRRQLFMHRVNLQEVKKQFSIQIKVALVGLTLGTFFSGCTTDPGPPTLWDINFAKTVSHQSNKSAKIVLINGEIEGERSWTFLGAIPLVIPVPTGPYRESQFNQEDQRIFSFVFRDELERLGLFKSSTDLKSAPRSDIQINLFFKKTIHYPSFQKYILEVEMKIIGNKQPFVKQYHIISSEGDSFSQRLNTSASEGKAKAGTKLLDQLIVDLQSWIAADQKVTLKE